MEHFIKNVIANAAGLLVRRLMLVLAGAFVAMGQGDVFAGQAPALEAVLTYLVPAALYGLSTFLAKFAAKKGWKLS
jgi:hypothetical protein